MKTKLSLTAAFLCFAISGFSQNKIEVRESNETFSTGNHNALSVIIYGADIDDVEKAWKKQLKDIKGSVKAKNEIFADDCRIKKMSDNTFDVYSKLEPTEEGVKVMAGFDLGGAYLTSSEHKSEFPFVKDLMYKFGVAETKAAIGNVIKMEEKKLEGLNDEKEDMEGEIEDWKKEIEEYKRKIENNEKSIEEKQDEIGKKKEEIGAQEEVVKAAQAKQNAVK